MPGVALTGVQKKTITDRVQLPRLYLAWLTPRHFEPGDAALDVVAAVLAGGKNSRLYKRLVYDMQIAQDVSAYPSSPQVRPHAFSPAACRIVDVGGPAYLNSWLDPDGVEDRPHLGHVLTGRGR